MVRHGCERQGYLCPFAGVHDCTICDEAGGCGRIGRFFPLSMSDFKPGDFNTDESVRNAPPEAFCAARRLLAAGGMKSG